MLSPSKRKKVDNFFQLDYEDVEDGHSSQEEKMINDIVKLFRSTRTQEALDCLDEETSVAKRALSVTMLDGLNQLVLAIVRRKESRLIEKMVDVGGGDLVAAVDNKGSNALIAASLFGSLEESIFHKLISAGGKKALMQKDEFGNTAFHYSAAWGASMSTIKLMINVGGREILFSLNNANEVPCSKDEHAQKFLCETGGEEYQMHLMRQSVKQSLSNLILMNRTVEAEIIVDQSDRRHEMFHKERNGFNSLIVAFVLLMRASMSAENEDRLCNLIKKMILLGGKELISENNNKHNANALHYAVGRNSRLEIIETLILTMGDDATKLLQQRTVFGYSTLHNACYFNAPSEVISYLVRCSSKELLLSMDEDKKQTPLEVLYNAEHPSNENIFAFQQAWHDLEPSLSSLCVQHQAKKSMVSKTMDWAKQSDSKYLLNNKFIKTILNYGSLHPVYLALTLMDLFVQVAIVVFIAPLVDQDSSIISGVVLSFCLLFLIGREVIQINTSAAKLHFTQFENLLDLSEIILLSLTILSELHKWTDVSIMRKIVIATVGVAWLELLFAFGNCNYGVSVFTSAVIQVSLVEDLVFNLEFISHHCYL